MREPGDRPAAAARPAPSRRSRSPGTRRSAAPAEQQQAAAAADLPDPRRREREDALDRAVAPLAHLVGRDGLAGVAAVPAADVERIGVRLGTIHVGRRHPHRRARQDATCSETQPVLGVPRFQIQDHVRGQPRARPPGPSAPRPPRPTAGCSRSAASTSPGSMRKPRSLTWRSRRPRNSSLPSASQRARSPVR